MHPPCFPGGAAVLRSLPWTRNAAKKRPAKPPKFVSVRAYERRWPGTSLHPPC